MIDNIRETRAAYDVIASEYAERWAGPAKWITAELDYLSAVLPRGARVADIGCGPGHHTRLLRERGFRATGFDLSWGMLSSQSTPGVAQADVAGHAGLVALITAARAQFPGMVFRALGDADGHHDLVRFGWELVSEADGTAPVAGFDVVRLDGDGRIRSVSGFLDRVPAAVA
ncbi:methyltransferase domain-containing protein [Streptomyces natalensis]|uniref:methyltransferase domain-containing protein n=1 Tax=Streptomyces natalensis TaxID=68242 RepID=UPI000AC7FDDC|nr:methyltransferase domain-containing protein [Streptomyces natalensis]